MVGRVFRKDQNIIEVYNHEVIKMVPEKSVHKGLKAGWTITDAHR